MDRVHREIVAQYNVDGIFSNRWAPQGGDCYCVHCQQNFHAATGLRPAADDRPARSRAAAVLEWRKARLTELWKQWDATVRAANPDARFIPNGPPDLKTAGELAAIQFTDNQARRGLTPPWDNGRRAKELRSVMGRRPIGGIFSVGVEEPYRWKDSVQSEPEIRLWVAEGTANGMRPWVTKFSGVLYDRRWLPAVERIYDWHFDHERYLRNEAPLARVALLHSEQTATYHRGVGRRRSRRRTTCSGCTTRWSKRACRSSSSTRRCSRRIGSTASSCSILADAAALSDAQCAAIRGYVERGGSVLATFATSLYDETGRPAERTSAWPTCSACRFAGRIDGPMQNSYLTLDADAGRRASAIRSSTASSDTPRIINGVFRVGVTSDAGDAPSPADADPDLSRPADGGRLPARAAHRHARAVPARRSGAAASSTFPGTSIARSGTC